MEFEKTIENLKPATQNEVAVECLEAMLNGEIHFHSGFSKNRDELVRLYECRLKSAKNRNPPVLETEALEIWELAMKGLRSKDSKELMLNSVNTGSKYFVMFWNTSLNTLEGIFWLSSKKTLDELDDYNQYIIDRGLTVGSIKYSKGRKVKEWN